MCPNDLNAYKGIVLPGERTEFHGEASKGDNIPNASFARAKAYCVHRRRTVILEVPGDVVSQTESPHTLADCEGNADLDSHRGAGDLPGEGPQQLKSGAREWSLASAFLCYVCERTSAGGPSSCTPGRWRWTQSSL